MEVDYPTQSTVHCHFRSAQFLQLPTDVIEISQLQVHRDRDVVEMQKRLKLHPGLVPVVPF